MRRVKIDSLQAGARLARTIFSSDGGVLLVRGVELKKSYIEKLKLYGIREVYIEDDISAGIVVKDVIEEETRNEAIVLVKKMMNNYNFLNSPDVEPIKKIVDKILDELLGNRDILYSLSEIRSVDDYTFEHSVNVCILSLITGIALEFDMHRLRELGIGAMLHDIGKLCIPRHILKKPSQLTADEFEEIKKHAAHGYELLKKSNKVDLISAYIAFGHHERYDGSGYPLNLKKENIQICARIVAVADVYDALTSDRVYRRKMMPNKAYEYITAPGTYHFDPRVVDSFVRFVTIYPEGTGVMLNTRERAIVVKNNMSMPTRPVVRIAYDDKSRKKAVLKEIDLSKQTDIFIVDSCEL